MPNWVAAILDNRPINIAMRVLVTLMFWFSGIDKLIHFPVAVGEMHHFHLEPAMLFAGLTTLTLLAGPALVIQGRYAWLGAGWLAFFTLFTIPIAHRFWEPGPNPQEHMKVLHGVMEHLSMCAGLFFAAAMAKRGRR